MSEAAETDPLEGMDADTDADMGTDMGPDAEPHAEADVASEGGSSMVTKPVPRITIDVFCDSPDTGAVMARAAEDRRLSKAHMSVHTGGIEASVNHYQDASTANLVIVESRASAEELFAQLGGLADTCDAGTKVIVIGHLNDISVYREMIRQGVNEYLVAPLTPIQVIESISRLYVDPDAPPIGRSVAFIGAKGGVGSSTIAHNVGWCVAENMHEDTSIIDFDLPFGTAGLDFNQDPLQGVAEALNAPERLDDVLLDRLLVKCTDRLSLFAAPSVLDRDFEEDPAAYENVLEVVRETVPCAVVDLPHAWTPWTRKLFMSADEIVITATPDLASLRNVKNMVDLAKAERANDALPHIVLNQVGVPKRPEIPVKDFGEAVGLDPTLVLPFNPTLFGEAANNGQMIDELEPKGKTAAGMRHLASAVTGRIAVDRSSKSIFPFLSKLARKKG